MNRNRIAYVEGLDRGPSSLERACLAHAMRAADTNPHGTSAEEIAAKRWSHDKRAGLILRANASPGGSGTSGFGAEVAGEVWGDFLESLEPFSAIAAIASRGLVSPLPGFGERKFPARTSAKASMAWVAENEPIPARSYTMGAVTIEPKKMAVISVFSRELARRADFEAIAGRILREDAGMSFDAAYLSTTAASTAAHAGLLDGLTAGAGFAGGDLTALETDIAALLAEIAPGGNGDAVIIMSPARAARFKIKAPLLAAAFPVLASTALADTRIVAVDPSALIHGFTGAPDIEASAESVLHMSDVPLEIVADSGPTTADPVRSMYQTAAIALRCILEIGFGKRRSNAVAYLDDPTW